MLEIELNTTDWLKIFLFYFLYIYFRLQLFEDL